VPDGCEIEPEGYRPRPEMSGRACSRFKRGGLRRPRAKGISPYNFKCRETGVSRKGAFVLRGAAKLDVVLSSSAGFGAEFGSRTSRQMGVFDGWDSHDPASGTKSGA